jgi:hypothetical protein
MNEQPPTDVPSHPVRGDAQVVGHVGGALAGGGEPVDVGDGQPGVVERVERRVPRAAGSG